jgi:hypothetical protein
VDRDQVTLSVRDGRLVDDPAFAQVDGALGMTRRARIVRDRAEGCPALDAQTDARERGVFSRRRCGRLFVRRSAR